MYQVKSICLDEHTRIFKWKESIPGCPMTGQQDNSSMASSSLEPSAKNSIGTVSGECKSLGLAKKLM
jgi:hypothetical protein